MIDKIIDNSRFTLLNDSEIGDIVFIPKETWQESMEEILEKYKVRYLRLSQSAGWHDSDLSFVSRLTDLKGLAVYSWNVTDLTPVQPLQQLEQLCLQCDVKKKFDFSVFTRLKKCFLRWFSDAETVFECIELKNLNIEYFPYTELEKLNKLNQMKHLSLTARKLESLVGIQHLMNLQHIDLYNCSKLDSLKGLENLDNLKTVELTACKKIESLLPISGARQLERLHVEDCGKIDSIKHLECCSSLQNLNLIGDTSIVDGDLSVILSLPNLKSVRLANKRHYRPNRASILKTFEHS